MVWCRCSDCKGVFQVAKEILGKQVCCPRCCCSVVASDATGEELVLDGPVPPPVPPPILIPLPSPPPRHRLTGQCDNQSVNRWSLRQWVICISLTAAPFLLMACCLGCILNIPKNLKPVELAPNPPPQEVKIPLIDARDLADTYRETDKGKIVDVAGPASHRGINLSKEPYVELGAGENIRVVCLLTTVADLDKISHGQWITVRGKCHGRIFSHMLLIDCSLR